MPLLGLILNSFKETAILNRQGLTPDAHRHCARAECRLFTDLVNLGHYAIAEECGRSDRQPFGEPVRVRCGVDLLWQLWLTYLLNHKRDCTRRGKSLSYARAAVLGEPSSPIVMLGSVPRCRRGRDRSPHGVSSDPGRVRDALQLLHRRRISLNEGNLDAGIFSEHVRRVLKAHRGSCSVTWGMRFLIHPERSDARPPSLPESGLNLRAAHTI